MRTDIMDGSRWWISLWVGVCLVALALWPLGTTVRVPAMLQADHVVEIHAPGAGILTGIHVSEGDQVEAGQLLFTLDSPALRSEQLEVGSRIQALGRRLDAISAGARERERAAALERELARERVRQTGLEASVRALSVHAPAAGEVRELDSEAHRGRPVGPREVLGVVVGSSGARVQGYLSGAVLGRIDTRFDSRPEGVFVPDRAELPSVSATLVSIARADVDSIAWPELASMDASPIAARERDGGPMSTGSWYVLTAEVASARVPAQNAPGRFHLRVRGQSLAERVWRRAMQVLVWETSLS